MHLEGLHNRAGTRSSRSALRLKTSSIAVLVSVLRAFGKNYLIRLTFFSLGACQNLWCPQNTDQSLSTLLLFFFFSIIWMQGVEWNQTKPTYTTQCFPRGKKETVQQCRSSIPDSETAQTRVCTEHYNLCIIFIIPSAFSSFLSTNEYADDVWDGIILKLCPIYALNDMSLCRFAT